MRFRFHENFIFIVLITMLACVSLTTPTFAGAFRGSYIKGTVLDELEGTGIGNVKIRVYDDSWTYIPDASTVSDMDGIYITGSLSPGRYYLRAICDYPDIYVAEYWFNSRDRDMAVPLEMEEGVDLLGIDFTLQPGGYVLGTIRSSEGYGLDGVDIDLYTDYWSWVKSFTCRSNEDGNYILGPIPGGNYFVRADPDAEHGCQQRYWPDAYYRDDATFIVVNNQDEMTGIDFELPPGGSVTGSIRSGFDHAVADCSVTVYSLSWQEQPIHQAVTGDDGTYLAYGLPGGSYYLEAEPLHGCGWDTCYYPGTKNSDNAQFVTVTEHEITEDINFPLPEGNFDIDVSFEFPATHYSPGDAFSLDLIAQHSGPALENLPAFILLDAFGSYYFWPSWTRFEPPGHPHVDYTLINLNPGSNEIMVFPSFIWPVTGSSASNLEFLGAIVNWSMTDLASNVCRVEWSFD
jgi:hypothetical protein